MMLKEKAAEIKGAAQALKWKNPSLEGFRALSRNKVVGLFFALVFGFVFSRAVMFQELAPFGLSYMGAVKKKHTLVAAALGASFGYLITREIDSLRYVAAVLILCGSKILFEIYHLSDKLSHADEVLVLAVCFFTGAGALVYQANAVKIVFLLTEAALCVSFTYFMKLAALAQEEDKKLSEKQEAQKKTALFIVGAAVLLSLSSVYLSFFSVGRILCTSVILAGAYHKGVKGGVMTGVICGIAASLSAREFSYLTAAMGAAGLCCGFLTAVPALMAGAYLLVFWMIGSYFSGISIFFMMAEAATGCVLFFLYSVFSKRNLVAKTPEKEPDDGEQLRLLEISKGIEDFASLLQRQIQKGDTGDINEVFHTSAQKVCARCGLNIYCWGQEYQKTMESVNQAAGALVRNGRISSADLTGTSLQKCVRSGEFLAELNDSYKRLQSGLKENELRDLQASVAQYGAFSALMKELALPKETRRYESVLSDKLSRLLREKSLNPIFAGIYRDTNGVYEALITFHDLSEITAGAKELQDYAKISAGCTFLPPEASVENDHVRLSMREQGNFYTESHHRCHPKEGERQCGDAIRFFTSRNGDSAALLCDGMGSGKTARNDSLFAVKAMETLVKNGVGAECALRFIGANLNYNDKESFTTVDLFCFSPYTGDATFLKSGAAPSFILSGGEIVTVPCESLPVGILPDLPPTIFRTKLKAGDVVILLSDGAMGENGDLTPLKTLLQAAYQTEHTDVRVLVEQAEAVCQNIRDDVSVAAIKICSF